MLLAALTALGCGSTGSGQSGSAFIFLSVDGFSATVDGAAIGQATSVPTARTSSTLVCVTLRNNLKNPTVTAPTSLDNVVIQSYTVTIVRLDGGEAPGAFTFNASVLVPAGTTAADAPGVSGNTATFGVIVVPAQLKNEPPLAGVPTPLAATAEIVFRGRDGRGQAVETSGAIAVLFAGTGATDSTCGAAPAGGETSPAPATS